MRGGARNFKKEWLEGHDLDDLEDFEPITSPIHDTDTLPEQYFRKSNHKQVDRARNIRRASKERLLNEVDET